MDSLEGDRLSNLSDDLIHKIFSSLDITQTIKTCVLSSRWRYIWTLMPYLNFSTDEFGTVADSFKFFTHVLSSRNSQIQLSSVKFAFRGRVMDVKTILEYAFSHNVQRLTIDVLHKKKTVRFPFSVFRSESLKHLTLDGPYRPHYITTSFNWWLPSLTTLILKSFKLHDDTAGKCVGPFSNCANLKNLTLHNCKLMSWNSFNICHPRLSSLTLYNIHNNINIVTPQLKSLTIRYGIRKLIITAPNLSSLDYTDYYDNKLDLSADFLCLEKVDICISSTSNSKSQHSGNVLDNVRKLDYMFQQLQSVKFLTLNLDIIETLSSSLELISHLPSPFTNLKSLKICPENVTLEEKIHEKINIPTEVKNYLLDGSPGANLIVISHEEIRVGKNATMAQKLMRNLHEELDSLKKRGVGDKPNMVQDNAPMDEQAEVENGRARPDTEARWHFGEELTRVESCWEEVNEQFKKGREQSRRLISMSREIERILAKLPESHRARLRGRYSGLRVEAGAVMDNMMDHLMNTCDKRPRFKCLLS